MLRETVALLPEVLTHHSPGVYACAAGAGVALALCGARFSRGVLTLLGVTAGTFVGLRLPGWIHWSVDPMGTAFCGAIGLGAVGYAMGRAVVSLLLSVVLAAWAGALVWTTKAGAAPFTWPALDWAQDPIRALADLCKSLPAGLNPAFPAALAVGACAGGLIAGCRPRLGRVLLFSFSGVALFLLAGALAAPALWPRALAWVPIDAFKEALGLCGLVGLSASAQWVWTPGDSAPSSDNESSADADDAEDDTLAFPADALTMDAPAPRSANRHKRSA